MSITTIEREQEHTLKGTRLQFLTAAGMERALHHDDVCWAFCMNFMETIDHDSEAYAEITDAAVQISEFIKKGQQAVRQQATNPLAEYDAQEMGDPLVVHKGATKFFNACWSVALKYRLVPTE